MGTGKSTLSLASARILGHHFDVRAVHVGKPPATFVSLLPRLILPLARRILPGHRSSARAEREQKQNVPPSLLNTLWLTVLAHDRRALLSRCWRYAAAGSIVIADRYPSATPRAVDSSRFDDEALARCGRGPKQWLMRRERALYTGLPQPTLVIRLTAPIETSLRRDAVRIKKEGPDPAAVKRRRKIEMETEFPNSRVISVDTDQPLEDTVKAVMQALWSSV
jgi:thymidylate kinase